MYHSCIDVELLGKQSLEKLNPNLQPDDWTYRENSNKNYTSEKGSWKDGWLQDIPEHYTKTQGKNLCI